MFTCMPKFKIFTHFWKDFIEQLFACRSASWCCCLFQYYKQHETEIPEDVSACSKLPSFEDYLLRHPDKMMDLIEMFSMNNHQWQYCNFCAIPKYLSYVTLGKIQNSLFFSPSVVHSILQLSGIDGEGGCGIAMLWWNCLSFTSLMEVINMRVHWVHISRCQAKQSLPITVLQTTYRRQTRIKYMK